MNEIDTLAKIIHSQNVLRGWWVDMNRCVYQTLQLVSTELAEATEGERKNLQDDHLPHRRMGEVKLADAAIRLLDLAGRYGWEYCGIQWVDRDRLAKVNTVAGAHLVCNMALARLADALMDDWHIDQISKKYTVLLNTIFYVGAQRDYDVIGALNEKLEYNKTRQDHGVEARAAENGKKF